MPLLAPARPRAHFLDLDFAVAGLDDVLAAVASADEAASFHYVVTPNVDHMVRLFEHRTTDSATRLREGYDGADLILCDSRVLSLLARRHGIALPVVPGSDLTRAVLERVARRGDRINVVGGSPGVLAALSSRFPGLRFAQHIPPMGLRTNPAALAEAAAFIASAPARFTFIAVGSPQQEMIALAVRQRGDAQGIGFCIGASIDFIVGRERRAPAIVQKLALEWLYRLVQDPARMWRRYLVEGPKIFRIVARWNRAA